MLKINRASYNENPVEEVKIISHEDLVIRRILVMSDGVTLLDETIEYDEKGRELSSVFMDANRNLIGFSERKYEKFGQRLINRIEYDNSGEQLHKFKYIYDENNFLCKVEVYNHNELVRYALITYPEGIFDGEGDSAESEWFNADNQQSDIPFKLDDIFSRAKEIYAINAGGGLASYHA